MWTDTFTSVSDVGRSPWLTSAVIRTRSQTDLKQAELSTNHEHDLSTYARWFHGEAALIL